MSQQIVVGQGLEVKTISNQSCCCTMEVIFAILFFAGIWRIAKVLWVVFASIFRKRLDLNKRYGGGWAVVTGGSEGIGEGIAIELAKQNFNLILVSRSLSKLQTAKQNILKINPKISIEVYSVDFNKVTTAAQYQQAFRQILEKDVSILVNNVGFYIPSTLINADFESIRTQMKVNLLPITVLTRLFVQKFMKRKQRSGLINLSSAAALCVFKGASNYSATKTFDDYFSRAIKEEVRGKIDVLTVRPFYVTSTMTRNTFSPTHCTPQQTGQEVVNSLGNTDICYGPFIHRLQGALVCEIRPKIITWVSNNEFKKFLEIYQKAK